MSGAWFFAGIAVGVVGYHYFIPWLVKRTGKSKDALSQITRNLNHDSFTNLKAAVEEESERRGL